MNTNKFIRRILRAHLLCVFTTTAFSATGFFGDGTGGAIFYSTTGSTSGEGTYLNVGSLNGTSFGEYVVGTSNLLLRGGEAKTFKNNGGDVFGVNQNYRIYLASDTPGSFTSFSLPFNADLGGGDQRWKKTDQNVNLATGLTTSGTYNVQFFWEQTGNQGTQFLSNGGNNYTTSFSIYYAITTSGSVTQSASGGTDVFAGSGKFVKGGSGTVQMTNANSGYTGLVYVDNGTLQVAAGAGLGNNTVNLGAESGSDNLTLSIADSDGGSSLANNITVRSTGGAKTISAENTSGNNTLSGGLTLNGAASLSSQSGGNLTFSGAIGGSGALTKSGAGTTTFSGSSANTMTGGVTVSAGTLILNKSANTAAVDSAVTIASGATVRTDAGNQLNNELVTVNGTLDLADNSQSLALEGAGTVTLGSATLTNDVGGSDTFSGKISGTGNLVKTGAGTAYLSGASDYSGTTTVSAGVLEIQNADALGSSAGGTTVADTATLKMYHGTAMSVADAMTINGIGDNSQGSLRSVGGSNTVTGLVTLGSNSRIGATGGNLTLTGGIAGGANVLFVGGADNTLVSGVISGSGNSQDGTTTSLFKDGAGVLTLSGNNNYTGDTRITAGAVTVASGGSLGNGSSDVFISSGATLNVNASSQVASLRETGTGNGGVAAIGSGATLTVSGNDYNAFMNSISGSGNLVKSGTGTMTLYGAQTYSGTTTVSGGKLSSAVGMDSSAITVSGGTFETTAANVVGNTTAVTVNSGTYSVGGSDSIGAISGSGGAIDITNGTLTTSFNAAASTYSGAVTGAGGFTKAGTGTLTLAGNNTKSGANTVSAGTLVVNGQLAGSTTVEGGATLAGSGSVGATTIGNGATISPGNSPGTLSLTNGLTFSAGGDYNWQIYNATGTAGSTNGWDLLAVSGGAWNISGLTTGSFDINLWSLSGISPDANGNAINFNNGSSYTWEILTYTSLTGTFDASLFNLNVAANNGATGFSNDLGGGVFSLAVDGNSLNLLFTPGGGPGPSPVPEPGTWAAAALLAGAAGYMRWRRRKQVEPKA